ncbi:kinase-like domain-containing protein [Glomus cerebriforme]|uniref:Kinase-like domain-containing protein n=1 Tax=Glomus cerebriforme TaxID=658196 RepID=A0A397TAV0_9GLOM|nr:kinase-like domain-containing protein [Glomus cerebriforme]
MSQYLSTKFQDAIFNVITERRTKWRRYPKIPEFIEPSIEPIELLDPFNRKKTDIRASIIRKSYKSLNVACIPINIPTKKDEAKHIIQRIEIMSKLNLSRNFLKFYGISSTIDTLIIVNEWAELGNLREVYNKYNISWTVKVQIALDICRGICFMHENKILYRNLQCANIMVSEYFEPKISNFEYSCYMDDKLPSNLNMDDMINWMAPEKIENFDSYKYDTKCEVFSFGMLLWELDFERIPYQDWNVQKIKNHVLNNNRENLNDESTNDKELYLEIIKNTWNQKPEDRYRFSNVFNKLENLTFSYYKNGISLKLVPKFTPYSKTISIDEVEEKARKWVEDAIGKKVIKSIEWSELYSMEKIGEGNFGSVYKACWSNIHNDVVCKKLALSSDIQYKWWGAFKHELHMQSRVHSCENIIRILGISKNFEDEYYIVMEYADEGDLKCYLSKNFKNLDWNKKFGLALDITNGLYFLHKEQILHRDLHAKNIVIHQGKAKITDFGYSKSMNTITIIHEKLFGNIPYVAPEIFEASKTKQDPYSEYSDIYSLGILLWEISSGQSPFKDQQDYTVIAAILRGTREERKQGTPDEYYELYNGCWNGTPEKRHNIEYVYNTLKKLLEGDKKEIVNKKDFEEDDLYLPSNELQETK